MYFPQFIQNYDPEQLEKNERINKQLERNRRNNLFNRKNDYTYEEKSEKNNDDFEL